jgi:hypothetical protein
MFVLYPYFRRTDRHRRRPSGMFTFKMGGNKKTRGRKEPKLVNQLYCSLFYPSLFIIAPEKVLISHSFFFVFLIHDEMVGQTWSWMLLRSLVEKKINFYIHQHKPLKGVRAISSIHNSLIGSFGPRGESLIWPPTRRHGIWLKV